jgi:hypothetical protein
MLGGTYFFECQCGDDEHTLRFVLNKDDQEIYAHVYLNQYHNVFGRIWAALKYIFGYKCKYGHWGEWILREEDAQRLRGMVTEVFGEELNDKKSIVYEKLS